MPMIDANIEKMAGNGPRITNCGRVPKISLLVHSEIFYRCWVFCVPGKIKIQVNVYSNLNG